MEDGTYLKRNGQVIDYASRWAYGYIVGERAIAEVPVNNADPADAASELAQAIASIPDGQLFGVWYDSEFQRTYVDIVVHVDAWHDAIEHALQFDQRYIYALRTETVIPVRHAEGY